MSNTREFLEGLKKNVKAALGAAGYRTTDQSTQNWAVSLNVSSTSSRGGASLLFGEVCEHCGETLPYRIINAQGTFGGRVEIPKDCDAATAADCLIRETLPLLTNRPPAAARHDTGVGAGLLSPQEAARLAEALNNRGSAH
ncbi:MAG: hypothetical protein ACREKL_01330 [Chthoniobacterales bacterium]